MDLGNITVKPKKYDEVFTSNGKLLDLQIVDFWRWSLSDLVENRNRGLLAEFIVKSALGIGSNSRMEWDEFDLETKGGLRIEVKSAAYIQAWSQKAYSRISFGIAPTKKLLNDLNYSDEKERRSDIYVFCLLHHKDQETIDPMNLDQWIFYVLKTKTLDEKLHDQKTIGLSSLLSFNPSTCSFSELKSTINKIPMRSC